MVEINLIQEIFSKLLSAGTGRSCKKMRERPYTQWQGIALHSVAGYYFNISVDFLEVSNK